jgi:DNA repair protein RadA/Sms
MNPSVDPLQFLSDDAGPRVYTIAEARLRVQESLEHLPVLGADGYIVKGWTHLLAGWWRLGKSELMAAVVLPWLRTGMRVLWISEEPESLWADRADMCDEIYTPVPWERLTLIDAKSAAPEALLDTAASINADVVIVDTIREACGINSMRDDDEVRAKVSPWLRRLRAERRTLIFLTQHRKAAGERGERVEGSVALPSMMDVVLELEAVSGQERQRRLTVRRRRSQTAPLVYEMDEDDRMVVIPDARSRSRVEAEAAALFVVNDSAVPLPTAAVRRLMTPKPSRDTVIRALTALAKSGLIQRNPPITEPAERRTVTWTAAGRGHLDLPQNSLPRTVEFAATDCVAADSLISAALTPTIQRVAP